MSLVSHSGMFLTEEVASGSEEEKDPEAATPENLAFAWSGRSKQSSEQDGFSSEASSEQGEGTHM